MATVNENISEIMATGFFTEYKFFRLLEHDDAGGISYVIQYFSSSIEQYNKYIEECSSSFRKKAFDKWGDRFIAFRTVMQIVN
ncbi:MAG: DUF4286 family protein [Bacteroidetes bacterium]|nr:MAG: DUF4286 family protein [Bacteroidota bacterium]